MAATTPKAVSQTDAAASRPVGRRRAADLGLAWLV